MKINRKDVSQVPPRAWDFWNETFIPKGCVVLLAGQGGSGKSTFMSWLADSVVSDKCRVLIASNEEDSGILVARANPNTRVMFASSLDDKDTKRYTVEDIIDTLPDFEIIFIDSLRTITDGDLRRSESIERILTPLVDAVVNTDKSIVLLTHTNKGGGETLQDMVSGSERLVSGVRHCNLTINDRIGNRRFITVAKTNCFNRQVDTTYVINPILKDVNGGKMTVVNNIAPFYDDIEQIIYNNSSKGKAQKYHKLLYGDKPEDVDKVPSVIKILQQEYDLGEPFSLEDIKTCGSPKAFYKYYNSHPEKFDCNKTPRNRRAGEKKMYWFK